MFDFAHETINAGKEHVRGIYHVQNVNAYGSRGWFVFMESLQNILIVILVGCVLLIHKKN